MQHTQAMPAQSWPPTPAIPDLPEPVVANPLQFQLHDLSEAEMGLLGIGGTITRAQRAEHWVKPDGGTIDVFTVTTVYAIGHPQPFGGQPARGRHWS